MPDMWDSEVVVVAEKVRGSELPQCVYQMNECIANPRDFRAALAAGKRLYSFKFNQTGASPISVPELCSHYCHGLKIRVFYFFYISKTVQMIGISFMAFLLNAVL